MGKMQRNKGAGYEREVCDAFAAALGIEVKRMIGQARDGGADILDVPPLKIEAKRRKTLGTVMGWLRQCMVSAAPFSPAVPIVVAREDAGESIVIVRLIDFLPMFKAANPQYGLAQAFTAVVSK